MAAIKGKNTKPEMIVRKFLHTNRFRYKLHDKSLPGKPDIIPFLLITFELNILFQNKKR
jgi:G:T-mismatch repair DNA endonuclease (very short patch repair protein)